MKTAIVTGANGFVGGALTRELLREGWFVYALDLPGHTGNLPLACDRCVFLPCALEEVAALSARLRQGEVDVLFHFAWAGSAGSQRADAALQLRNVQWTLDVLRMAKALGCPRVVCAGSIMEHETIAATYASGTRPGMGYIYGAGKLAAHAMAAPLAAELGVDLLWAEITNAYGIGERSPRLVNTTLRKCLQGEDPQFTSGTQMYDFVYVDDVAVAFRLIAERGRPFHDYLIGSGSPRPLRAFLEEMREAVAPERIFHFGDVPFTGIALPATRFDCSATTRDTGFRAQIDFAEGCRRTYAWWQTILREEHV